MGSNFPPVLAPRHKRGTQIKRTSRALPVYQATATMSLKWAAVAAVATILGLAHGGSVRVKRADAGAWTPDLSGLNSDQLIKMINAGLAQKQRRSAPAPVMSALPPRSTFERNARASNLQAMYDNFYSNEGLNGERGYGPNANANMLNQMNMGLYKRSTPNRPIHLLDFKNSNQVFRICTYVTSHNFRAH